MLNLALLALVATPPSNALLLDRHAMNVAGPNVEVWTNKDDDVMQRGEQVRVYFRASESGYVTVFRVDTDGRLRVLYPTEPWEDNYARANQQYEVRSSGDRHSFVVDDSPGEGYVFAVVSRDPFNYGTLVRGDHWDYRVMAESGRVTGDPYVALTDLVDRIVPPNYSEYSYDVLPYFVEQHYQYPRFLCYECHAYASYQYWNPYSYSCFRFRIVIYDDFNYFSSRRYRGSRTIYRTSPRLAPRYVFKDRGQSEPFVTNVRERPLDQSGRRLLDPGVTVRDLGPTGRVPAPISTGRRPSTSSDPVSGNAGGRRQTFEPQQNPGARTVEPGRRVDPRDPPSRQPADGGTGQVDGRRPNDQVIPPVTTGEPARPRLERRDPNREPESQPETRQDPRAEPRRPVVRPDPQPERQPERQPARQPERQPERPQVEKQPEPREQPKASSEPARRAEPRSAPARPHVEKPQEPDESSGRRPN